MIQKILVIKHGALGDFIQASSSFRAIREYHVNSEIYLLTTNAFLQFALRSPWFDKVRVDQKPKLYNLHTWLVFRSWLRKEGFSRVYDLQTSERTGFYYKLFWPDLPPEWSGIATGCSHPHSDPERDLMHTIERQSDQLREAGITNSFNADYKWVRSDVTRFNLTVPFIILVPGGASHRSKKRWPVRFYKKLARHLHQNGLYPVVIGGLQEKSLADFILDGLTNSSNLTGCTTIEDLFSLARHAYGSIGNDTGPMHIFSCENCPTLVLFSNASDPEICGQRGLKVKILQSYNLAELTVDEVIDSISFFDSS